MAQSQTKGMRPLPDDVINHAQKNPHESLGQLARLGIVANPREFQSIMLPKADPDLAKTVKIQRIVFKPQPMSASNLTSAFPIPTGVDSLLKSMLQSVLPNRSFAPSAVRIRITKEITPIQQPQLTPTSHPILDEIGRLYNSYRFGLLKNMHNVDKMVVKLAEFSDISKEEELLKESSDLSKVLFSIGYWPSVENLI
jgi:hypothetical protein